MPYSEPTNLAIVACPGGEAFANAVITHLRNMYKHRFTLKNDVISKKMPFIENQFIFRNNFLDKEKNEKFIMTSVEDI